MLAIVLITIGLCCLVVGLTVIALIYMGEL